ncbi:Aste57867_17633 [Aphanomyces stellatus]|uniref:Aste57867_17633 protein n=1 Tax=Aphanomyces stellatus TaxID=120398 RepID=A0A485L923_9STRA|nr:hypothetical protein As57867_017573 [Aphanomyces stellatus]VFT94384.1 Aste57867_17633 [Aphanomyces stellatus]
MSPIHPGLAYAPTVGLKLPHIPPRVQYQRIRRLQLLVRSDHEDSLLWTFLPKQLWQRCMAPFNRPFYWDILLYSPNFRTRLLNLAVLPTFWRKVWMWWDKVPLTKVCPAQPTSGQLLCMSVWLQKHPLFLVPGTKNTTTCIAIALRTHRPWYKHIVERGFHSLGDFLTPSRHWPTYAEFVSIVVEATFQYELDDCPGSFEPFYKLLTLIAYNVWDALDMSRTDAMPTAVLAEYLPTSLTMNGVPTPFHLWPHGYVRSICFHAPSMSKPHPLLSSSRKTLPQIQRYIRHTLRPLLAIPPPIYADVWWRVLFRMLPTNYKYFFLQTTNPRIMECSYPGCSAVETEQHILFDCHYVQPIWSMHRRAWSIFGRHFTWKSFLNMDDISVPSQWTHQKTVIQQLWVLLVAVLQRELWICRNKSKFDSHPVPFAPAVSHATLVTWSACVRRWLNDPHIDSDSRLHTSTVLDALKATPQYSWFWERHPKAFQVSKWFDTHSVRTFPTTANHTI